MAVPSLAEMFGRLIRADEQGRTAKTVEWFGWLCLVEGLALLSRRVRSLRCCTSSCWRIKPPTTYASSACW